MATPLVLTHGVGNYDISYVKNKFKYNIYISGATGPLAVCSKDLGDSLETVSVHKSDETTLEHRLL